MPWTPFATAFLVTTALLTAATTHPVVQPLRLPDGGIQPQVVRDAAGEVHVVYYSGDAGHGDLFYIHSNDGGSTFSTPIRVNSQAGSAIAAGNIRGARLAVGPHGRVHVAWNGSGEAEPKTADGKTPMLYTHLDSSGKAFAAQRNLIQSAPGLDGGGALAADAAGNVYVFWHAPRPGGKDEGDRRVWLAQSHDYGATFDKERIAFDQPTGVCGCCGMQAFTDPQGHVYALFRAASEVVNRDMYLLVSKDHGQSFAGSDISKWKIGICVMSSESFAQSTAGTVAAWETEKQVYYAPIDAAGRIASPIPAPGSGPNRKYPSLAANRWGQTLLAWTEGMGWKKGGSLAWQVFDSAGQPVGAVGRAEGVPAWGLIAAFTAPDGSFRILY